MTRKGLFVAYWQPVQPAKKEVASGVAVIVALLSASRIPVQVFPEQWTNGVVLVRMPLPVPVVFAVS